MVLTMMIMMTMIMMFCSQYAAWQQWQQQYSAWQQHQGQQPGQPGPGGEGGAQPPAPPPPKENCVTRAVDSISMLEGPLNQLVEHTRRNEQGNREYLEANTELWHAMEESCWWDHSKVKA